MGLLRLRKRDSPRAGSAPVFLYLEGDLRADNADAHGNELLVQHLFGRPNQRGAEGTGPPVRLMASVAAKVSPVRYVLELVGSLGNDVRALVKDQRDAVGESSEGRSQTREPYALNDTTGAMLLAGGPHLKTLIFVSLSAFPPMLTAASTIKGCPAQRVICEGKASTGRVRGLLSRFSLQQKTAA